jgi:hypothetical protein
LPFSVTFIKQSHRKFSLFIYLILSFPVLKYGGGDFLDGISYVVGATQAQNNRKLYITHTLKGNSFICQLVKDKKAKFSHRH